MKLIMPSISLFVESARIERGERTTMYQWLVINDGPIVVTVTVDHDRENIPVEIDRRTCLGKAAGKRATLHRKAPKVPNDEELARLVHEALPGLVGIEHSAGHVGA